MKRLLMLFGIVLILAMVLAGCGKKEPVAKEAPPKPPIPADIAEVASKVLELGERDEWGKVYDYLHSDVQAQVTREEFIATKNSSGTNTKIKYKKFELKEHKVVSNWSPASDPNNVFAEVAEVYYTVTVETPVGEEHIDNNLQLAKDSTGAWKYLWIK